MANTTTYYSYGNVIDEGFIRAVNTNFSSAVSGTGIDWVEGNTTQTSVGNELVGSNYSVWESFLHFPGDNTVGTTVPRGAIIHSATLDLYVFNVPTTDFTVEVYPISYYFTLNSGDWVDASGLSTANRVASLDTSSAVINQYNTFTSDGNLVNSISSLNTTFVLLSANARTLTAPSDNEILTIYTALSSGTTRDPKLTIEWDYPGAFIGDPF